MWFERREPTLGHQVISAAVTVAVEQQRSWVDTVDHTIGRNMLRCATEACEPGKPIAEMKDIANDLPRFDHPGPGGDARDAIAAFGEIALTAGIESLDHAARTVLGEGTVIGLDDDQGVPSKSLLL